MIPRGPGGCGEPGLGQERSSGWPVLTASGSLCENKEVPQSSVPSPSPPSGVCKDEIHCAYNTSVQVGSILYQQRNFKGLRHCTGHLFTASLQGTKSRPRSQPPTAEGPCYLPCLSRPLCALPHGRVLEQSSKKWVLSALSFMGL